MSDPIPATLKQPLESSAMFPTSAACKCCGTSAALDGYADFDRDCYGFNAKRSQIRGIPIPYYRCLACEFAFTDAFDEWSPEDFKANIYNDEYELFDPNYASIRPKRTAELVQHLARSRNIRILDYGSGNGLTAGLLRDSGYKNVTEYDPFHGDATKPSQGGFDLVLCIEVAEHVTQPIALFAELGQYVSPQGIILLSTKDMSAVPGRWSDDWYVAPRNGHISFYTSRTLQLLANSMGRRHHQLDGFRHLLMPLAT